MPLPPHLIATVRALQERGIGFRSLSEQIDTTTPSGKLIFYVFGALKDDACQPDESGANASISGPDTSCEPHNTPLRPTLTDHPGAV